uniref:Zinc metalloprotease n=1 Tax=Cyanothece sp. (strain PCC 7425 / ATCC 29141) TaxID=395961 RepID=B8HNK6_CYAP4
MSFLSVLAAIAVLAVLIVVHEAGHFLAARWQGIHVNRFSIGFGPVLWKYQGPETEYALRGFPLGGYVGFPDDDPDSAIAKNDPNLLRNRPVLDRAIVISAGVIANLVFAYLLLVTQVGILGVPQVNYQPGVVVPQLAADTSSAAAKAGIKAGDIILAANGEPLGASETALPHLMEVIRNNGGQPIAFKIQRQQQQLNLTVTPDVSPDGKARIGVQLSPNGTVTRQHTLNPIAITGAAATEFERIVRLTLGGFVQLFSHFDQAANQVSGPVAIVAMGADIARSDATRLLQFAALISINLAIINILPLPALDGGQLAFLLIEALQGKPIPSRIQEGVMQTGLVLLLGLGMFLIVRDTVNLASMTWVQRLFQ